MSTEAPQFKRGPIVASLLIGAFVALLSQTFLNVALPGMMKDLQVSENTIQWLSNGYMLVSGVLVPISAFLIERFTTRKLFIAAVGLFTLGTIISGFAPGFELLLTGRLVQAAGAGVLMPLMSIVFLTIFPVEERGKAMGMMGVAMIFAPAIGPTLSGWIMEHYSWRALFYIIIPLSAFALIFGAVSLKNVTRTSKPRLDILGVILSTLGFGGLLYGFSDAGKDGWDSTIVVTCLTVGAVSLILFIWRELVTEKPILEFRVFKFNMYSLTTVINVIVTMAMFSGMILLPLYLQNIRGFTPFESGLLLLPGAILMGIMSPITGIIFDKVGARWLSVIGLLIMTVTTYEFSKLTIDTTYTTLILLYTIRSFGMSMLMMPIQTAGMNQLPQRLNAHGSAMSQTLRNVAGAIGTALLVSLMTNAAKSHGAELVAAGGINPADKVKMAEIAQQSAVYGINHSFVVATWMTVAALVMAFFIRKVKPHVEIKHESVVIENKDVETVTVSSK
ncbi:MULTISPECIES: DHA2 family efflux MFS transporter permease subunit [Paenibacillus]|uniref:DHA2 family efflux MFS transporter permease subunit n=1 Tax=Paenibacillus TaxID=44249 RepID=UPI00034E1E84|nr:MULTISPECIES: DHA2 family efflux MFS transporter permease subunit [Paenibacillus]EPD81982.1 drug:H+ antiporter-2 (14 Spanner) (DHA2) family drug resistance MFS transporter [Paenibacillus sp. HGH0039]MBV6713953.1 DHA2 family efflux MFS transporter permease subunit [Paenibacillus chitinolyticus]